jgi:tetratricopeptide (TPR) repeat protein
LFLYYIKMNEAFCLLSSEMNDEIYAAKDIYEKLLEKFKEYPLVHYRLGQVYNKLGLLDDAVNMYSSACKLIVNYRDASLIGSKELPKNDYEHMSARLKKIWGYSVWQLSQRETNPNNSYKLINEAYNLTVEGLGDAKDDDAIFSMHNNALYYLVEMVERHGTFANKEDILKKSQAHLSFLEDSNKKIDNISIEHLDTLTKAYYFHNNFEQAESTSKEVIRRILDRNYKSVTDSDALKMASDAQNILNNIKDQRG